MKNSKNLRSVNTECELRWIDVNTSVAAHLRGMRPTLTARKATQCLEETQTLTELSI